MGLPYAEASWERLHALRQPDALKAIAKYHDVRGIAPGSLGHGVQTMSDPNGWLKPGLQVEVAGTDTHAGGGWRLLKVLEAGDASVLVEGRKPADMPTPAAAPAPVLIRLPASPVGTGEGNGEGAGVKEEGEGASPVKEEAMDTSAEGGATQAAEGAAAAEAGQGDTMMAEAAPAAAEGGGEAEAGATAAAAAQKAAEPVKRVKGKAPRERPLLGRARPLPPRTPKDFRPVSGQAVQVSDGAGGWWAAVVKAGRKKGEPLLDDESFHHLRRELATRRAAMQASLQPRQSADDFELGMRIAGRDGKQWEVVMDQEEEWRHRWSSCRKAGQGKGGLGGTKRRRCGECAGCVAENCGACGNCLDMPKFGGPGTRRQTCARAVLTLTLAPTLTPTLTFTLIPTPTLTPTLTLPLTRCERRVCLHKHHEDEGDKFRRQVGW